MTNPFAPHSSLLAVSDCHLTAMDDARSRDFFTVCQWVLATRPEYFLMLGDIFDFALGSKSYYRRKYREVGEAMAALTAAGIKVVYVEGNHEADVKHFGGDGGWNDVTFVTEGTHFLTTADGISLQLAHGDMIYSHNAYKRFRAVVKSAPFKWLVRQLPGALIDALFLQTSAVSRARDDYREFRHKELIETLEDWLLKGGSQFGLFGHFHQPYGEWVKPAANGHGTNFAGQQDKGSVTADDTHCYPQLVSVDSWDNPSVLSLEGGSFYRYAIHTGTLIHKEPCLPILAGDKNTLLSKAERKVSSKPAFVSKAPSPHSPNSH